MAHTVGATENNGRTDSDLDSATIVKWGRSPLAVHIVRAPTADPNSREKSQRRSPVSVAIDCVVQWADPSKAISGSDPHRTRACAASDRAHS